MAKGCRECLDTLFFVCVAIVGVLAHRGRGLIPTDHGVFICADRLGTNHFEVIIYLSRKETFDRSCMTSLQCGHSSPGLFIGARYVLLLKWRVQCSSSSGM